MNAKLMKVVIRPSHGNLDDVMQIGDGGVAADQQSAPDHRANVLQHHFELINDGVGILHDAILPA